LSDFNDIVDGNGEHIEVVADDSADGQSMYQDGERVIAVDEDALIVFAERTGLVLEDLEPVRALVTGGDLAHVPQFGRYGDMAFRSIDAQNLKLGTLPEAAGLAAAYFRNFYVAGADQVERVCHGIGTGGDVAGATIDAYLDSDGNAAADIDGVASEFLGAQAITGTELAQFETSGETGATAEAADEYRTDF
jgi:hypothetical protein